MIGEAIMRDGLQAIRRFLEEKRGFAGRVTAHFARMGRIIPPDAIDPAHGKNEIRVGDRNSRAGCDGDGKIRRHWISASLSYKPQAQTGA